MATSAYRKALDLNPSLGGAYLPLAEILMGRSSYGEAIEILQKGTERMPENAELHYRIGICYYSDKQPDAAFDAYKKAAELDPNMAKAHYGQGKVLLDKQDVANALPLLQKAVELEPEDPDFLTDYGGALVAQSQFDQALPLLEKAASTPEYNNPGGLYNLGFAQLQTQQFDAAVTSFQKAAEALPTWAAPQLGLGYAIFSTIKPGCPCGPEDDEKVQRISEAYQKALELGTDEPGLKERLDALAKGEKVK
jgi:tetratricopeptide (TPR) repeat protein